MDGDRGGDMLWRQGWGHAVETGVGICCGDRGGDMLWRQGWGQLGTSSIGAVRVAAEGFFFAFA